MGNFTSKLFYHEHDKPKQFNSSSLVLENHDTCTPQPHKRKSLIDPRSATLGIVRTPIEIISSSPKETEVVISAVPKYLQRKPYLETNFDVTPTSPTLEESLDPRSPNVDMPRTPILLETLPQTDTPKFSGSHRRSKNLLLSEMRQKMLGLDPRSPAYDFDRTPILKPKSVENAKARSHENLNTSIYDTKIPSSRLSFCETTTYLDVPEVNVLPDVVASLNNSESPSNASDSSCSSGNDTCSDNSACTVLRNLHEDSLDSSFGSSSSDSSLENPRAEKKTEDWEAKLVADSENIIDNVLLTAMKDFEVKFNEAENKIKIWRDTLSPVREANSDSVVGCVSEARTEFTSPKDEVIIEFDDGDCNLQGTIKKPDNILRKSESEEKKKKRIVQKEIEGKKLFSPSKKHITEAKNLDILSNRTPLRNRSNSNSKSHGTVLKSPHLRRKAPFAMRMHQENTPPNGKKTPLKSRLNHTKWDGDSTVII
ncbi:uncharacterized protein LOC117169295 [Belonocnema kinseyi]|uniref:uncharacterized protein LOC117169295 n=1 Tax=Belonocnema kinseyi TaxID=2817044 RepID=UPI00143D7F40|nr:uncharacterized protein LOC117169295 [Belonocnema kinseyi]